MGQIDTVIMIKKRVGEIAHSLITEGYTIRHRTTLARITMWRMRHSSNRNEITLIGRFEDKTIKVIKNGKTVKTEEL